MKRIKWIVLVVLMCMTLCACSDGCNCGCEYCCTVETTREDTPITYAKTESSEENLREPELAVEDFEITKMEGDELWFRVKIRNVSDRDLEKISFQYQVLDKNGDILRYQLCGANNVASGQAIWAGKFSIRDLKLEEVDAMGFVSDWSGNTPALKERVVFRIADYR